MCFPENVPLNQSIEHLMFRRMLIVWRNLWASQPRQICDLARPAKQLLASWEVVCQAASNLSNKKVFPRSFHLRFQELLVVCNSSSFSIRGVPFRHRLQNADYPWCSEYLIFDNASECSCEHMQVFTPHDGSMVLVYMLTLGVYWW